jgi:hypothetical protein
LNQKAYDVKVDHISISNLFDRENHLLVDFGCSAQNWKYVVGCKLKEELKHHDEAGIVGGIYHLMVGTVSVPGLCFSYKSPMNYSPSTNNNDNNLARWLLAMGRSDTLKMSV